VARYKVFLKPSAVKEIETIDSIRDRRRIVRRIQGLAEDPLPPGSEKLSGEEKYRVRQGDFRIVYAVDDHGLTVTIVRIGHRREVYR
jgi:mRNA interferase RelE/StbE